MEMPEKKKSNPVSEKAKNYFTQGFN